MFLLNDQSDFKQLKLATSQILPLKHLTLTSKIYKNQVICFHVANISIYNKILVKYLSSLQQIVLEIKD